MPHPPLPPAQDLDLRAGAARLRENLLNHAELLFKRVLAVDPAHPTAQRLLGVTLYKLGQKAEGLNLLRSSSVIDPDPPAVWADMAVVLKDLGDAAGADAAYSRAIGRAAATPPNHAFASDRTVHEFTVVDYPYRSTVRYGAGRPPHPQLSAMLGGGRERYRKTLSAIGAIRADFADIALGGSYDDRAPFWLNAWLPPLDGMVLTEMLRSKNPGRFVEIGSGVSTKFARRAVERYGLRTRLISIDPQPRNEIDDLCDQVLRKPLETCGLEMFESLEPGDIFFLDSSHRSFQGSDVTVFFMDILPRLKPGVIVQIHDIYLPDDYISGHVRRMWNEQYLLATALLFGGGGFEILFPSWYVGQDPDLSAHAKAAINLDGLAGLNLYGASFWLTKT